MVPRHACIHVAHISVRIAMLQALIWVQSPAVSKGNCMPMKGSLSSHIQCLVGCQLAGMPSIAGLNSPTTAHETSGHHDHSMSSTVPSYVSEKPASIYSWRRWRPPLSVFSACAGHCMLSAFACCKSCVRRRIRATKASCGSIQKVDSRCTLFLEPGLSGSFNPCIRIELTTEGHHQTVQCSPALLQEATIIDTPSRGWERRPTWCDQQPVVSYR